MKKYWVAAILLLHLVLGFYSVRGAAPVELKALTKDDTLSKNNFLDVPDSVRPWAYYWWLKGNVTRESITHDLEEMRAKGFGGILLFDSRGYHEDAERHIPVPLEITNEFMSQSWQDLVVHLVKEADRLGLKVSLNLSNTGGHLRGPWDFKEEGPREIIWSEGNLNGPKKISISLDVPADKAYYKDVALLGVRIRFPKTESRETILLGKTWSSVTPPTKEDVLVEETIDLSANMKEGILEWDVPEGTWKILRFGTQVIGDFGSLDILNKDIVTKYFHRMGTRMLDQVGEAAGRTLTHCYNVSWEGSNPNWTDGFPEFFKQQRGYDLQRYMPVLRGLVVGDFKESERFMVDFNRSIGDAFCLNCYQQIGKLCHERGIVWHSEDGGPWTRTAPMFKEADMLTFWGQNDIPQGEFWVTEKEKLKIRSNMRFTAMASHIYGQPIASVEAFTHMVHHWTMYPAHLKPSADVNFVDGANLFVWHTFTASPPELGKPGYEYFAGTHINPRVTWWEKVGGFLAYLGRCQYLLQKGKFAADVCVYASDKNYVAWGHGEKWNPNSSLVLPTGYTYDLLDTEVLVHRLRFEKGRFVLPDGMNYKILVLDPLEKELSAASLEKIYQLAEQGGTIVLGKTKPINGRGLVNFPQEDQKIAEIVAKLWGDGKETVRSIGKGKVYLPKDMNAVLVAEKIVPDVEGPFAWHHRILNDADVYFISGTGSAECTFRVTDSEPELWNPVTGKTSPVKAWRTTNDGRTTVDLELAEFGATFVVFQNKPEKETAITSFTGLNTGWEVVGNKADRKIIQWQNGDWELTLSNGKKFQMVGDVAPALELIGPWNVAFDPKWGGPAKTVFEKLSYWNENENEGIRFYSGSALYSKTFELTAEQASLPCRLELGTVRDIASVKVNGNCLGVVWTAPWSVDLSGVLKEGANTVEIDVTNCWVNRLIGDTSLPKEKRLTNTNVQYFEKGVKHNVFQGFSPDDTLRPSGLVGPVRVEFGKVHQF